MTKLTPVAWERDGYLFRSAYNDGRRPLYSANQLRQARADALREAAEVFGILGGASCEQLRRMASTIENNQGELK